MAGVSFKHSTITSANLPELKTLKYSDHSYDRKESSKA